MEFSFIWLARFSWPARCSSVFTSVSSPFSPFLFAFVSLSQTPLYFFEVNYFLELWGLFRSTSQALHQHGQNLHIRVLLRYFSWKKTCNFWVWIEALTVIITKSSLLDNCCPICLIWFVRSSSHSESNFSHFYWL